MDDKEIKEFFKNTFNTVAEGYDNSAMRFFPDSAKQISSFLNLKGDEHVLDVATGTGSVALTIAKELHDGKVTGIDFSEGMLAQAQQKKDKSNAQNLSFIEMDMQAIDFPDNYFDAAVTAFGIFFIEDMKKQLAHIAEKVKPGGKVLTTTFFDTSFLPLSTHFLNRLEKYGVEVPTMAWKRVATKEQCVSLFQTVGLQHIKSEKVDCGYHLKNVSEWWYIIWNGGFRGLVNQLKPTDLERFKEEHLAEIEELATEEGIWLEMDILYTVGTK